MGPTALLVLLLLLTLGVSEARRTAGKSWTVLVRGAVREEVGGGNRKPHHFLVSLQAAEIVLGRAMNGNFLA